jgi:hypothetical protein
MPSEIIKARDRQSKTGTVSGKTTNVTEHLHCTREAISLPVSPLARPTRAHCYHKPSSKPKCNRRAPDFPLALPSHPCLKIREGKEKEQLVETAKELGDARWPKQDAISMETTSASPLSPEVPVADAASALGQRIYTIASEAGKATLMPCSNEAECSAHSATDPPASPNNDLTLDKIARPPSFWFMEA